MLAGVPSPPLVPATLRQQEALPDAGSVLLDLPGPGTMSHTHFCSLHVPGLSYFVTATRNRLRQYLQCTGCPTREWPSPGCAWCRGWQVVGAISQLCWGEA